MFTPVKPMLLSSRPEPFNDPAFNCELKFDGVRMLLYKRGGEVSLVNRRLHNRTAAYAEITVEAARLPGDVILDGEVIAADARGAPDFYRVMRRDRDGDPSPARMRAVPVTFIAFDVLYANGRFVTDKPLYARRGLLDALFSDGDFNAIKKSEVFPGADAAALFEATRAENLEGIVLKRADGVYVPGARARDWFKVKNPDYRRPPSVE